MVVHTYLLVMRPCSHVVCKGCTDSLVRPPGQCIVCDQKLTAADIVEVKREGTLNYEITDSWRPFP